MRQAQRSMRNSRADEQIWLLTQRELFELTEVRVAGKFRKLPRIEVYFRNLATAAAKGDTSAIAEQRYYIKKLGKLEALARPELKPEQHPITIEMENNKTQSEYTNIHCSIMYLTMIPDFIRRYEARYGQQDYDRHVKPHWLNYQPVLDRLNVIIARRRREAKRGKAYEVGRSKPPRDSQWPHGQSANPAGRPRRDIYDTLRESWSEEVAVQTAGGEQRVTKYALSVRQTILKAQAGKPAAMRTVRSMIQDLEERGLFCRPKRSSRRRRPSIVERTSMAKSMQIVLAPIMKRGLLTNFAANFGPIDDFTTRVELDCQKYLEDDEFAAVHRARMAKSSPLEFHVSDDKVDAEIEDYEAEVGVPEGEYVERSDDDDDDDD